MADGTLQILGLGTSAVPLEYTASGDQSLDLVAVNADYDGGAAGVDWQPVVEIISTAGHVMARGVGPTVAAGDSASVTFAPFLKGAATSTTGGGIQYGVRPQPGTFLQITTTDAGANSLNIQSGGELDMRSDETLTVLSHADLEVSSAGAMTIDSQAGITITNTAAGVLLIESSPDGGIDIRDQGGALSNGVTVESAASGVSLSGEYIVATVRSDDFYVVLGAGRQLQVQDSGHVPIFEVREDGSLHGKTGQALTFDL